MRGLEPNLTNTVAEASFGVSIKAEKFKFTDFNISLKRTFIIGYIHDRRYIFAGFYMTVKAEPYRILAVNRIIRAKLAVAPSFPAIEAFH